MKMVTFSIRKRFLGIADCKRPFNNLGFNMWPTRTFAFSCYGPHHCSISKCWQLNAPICYIATFGTHQKQMQMSPWMISRILLSYFLFVWHVYTHKGGPLKSENKKTKQSSSTVNSTAKTTRWWFRHIAGYWTNSQCLFVPMPGFWLHVYIIQRAPDRCFNDEVVRFATQTISLTIETFIPCFLGPRSAKGFKWTKNWPDGFSTPRA